MVKNYEQDNVSIMRNNTSKNYNQITHTKVPHTQNKNTFKVFSQNICGLLHKKDELYNSLSENFPQIICLTEHHLSSKELGNVALHHYRLGASCCRPTYKFGGVCIYVQDNMYFTSIDMNRYSKEKDIEICAVKLCFSTHTVVVVVVVVVVSVYRSPAGSFSYFNNLEIALNHIYDNSIDILCGDFNINYLTDNHNKQLLDSLLTSYNLYSTVDFPTRICNGSNTAIYNIFINIFKNDSFSAYPLINGLSDHDA
jgi:hypothetical protein